jgi:hypothetical protein
MQQKLKIVKQTPIYKRTLKSRDFNRFQRVYLLFIVAT